MATNKNHEVLVPLDAEIGRKKKYAMFHAPLDITEEQLLFALGKIREKILSQISKNDVDTQM
jgi:hypothetical protein